MTSITTPSGLSVIIDRGTRFRTAKGRYIITEVLRDDKGDPQAVHFVPVADQQQVGFKELTALVAENKVML